MDTCLIIPAYNEAARIAEVVTVAKAAGVFGEILVIDDGSNDGTAAAAGAEGVRVITHDKNMGKSRAMLTGLENTTAEIVAFLDADLLNVSPEHIGLLTEPVVSGKAEAALAVFAGGRMATTLAQKITPMISGQRCVLRRHLDGIESWDARFGIETVINDHLRSKGIEQLIVQWPGAAQVMKEEKRGCLGGVISRLGMYRDILSAWVKTKR